MGQSPLFFDLESSRFRGLIQWINIPFYITKQDRSTPRHILRQGIFILKLKTVVYVILLVI